MNHLNFSNKRTLLRVDFNVPLNDAYEITDTTRIDAALPTIQHILDQNGALILLSHLGRPQKKRKADGTIDRFKYSLRHLLPYLVQRLKRPVTFIASNTGQTVQQLAQNLKAGEILLLENTRFNAGETKGDEAFGQSLAHLADIYINDAFGTAHRAHSSTYAVAKQFDASHKGFGLLMQAELKNGNRILNDAQKPFAAIIGGAKVSDKILLLQKLVKKVDHLFIGGGMAYTFIKAKGGMIGKSLCEDDRLDEAKSIMDYAAQNNVNIHLPADSLIADAFDNDAQRRLCPSDQIPDGWMGLDIGTEAIKQFAATLQSCKTILWNGPMGVFEMEHFAKGTKQIAEAVARATDDNAYSLVGGGDSVAAIKQMKLDDEVSYVSTGGGAMLKMLEGEILPAVQAMNE